jgi:hypothetical protein
VRVVPLCWLLTLLMVAVALVAPGLFKTLKVQASTLAQSLLFIPHFSQSFPGVVWPLLVPGWTAQLTYHLGDKSGQGFPRNRGHRPVARCAAVLLRSRRAAEARPSPRFAAVTAASPNTGS